MSETPNRQVTGFGRLGTYRFSSAYRTGWWKRAGRGPLLGRLGLTFPLDSCYKSCRADVNIWHRVLWNLMAGH